MKDWVGLLARLVTRGVWIVAGALKLPDPAASVRAVRAYDLLPESVVPTVGHVLPALGGRNLMSKENSQQSRAACAAVAIEAQRRGERRRRTAIIGSIAAVLVLLVGAGAWSLSHQDTTGTSASALANTSSSGGRSRPVRPSGRSRPGSRTASSTSSS